MDISTLFLGAIAVSTLMMAVVQIGIIVYGMRLAKRVDHVVELMEKEVKPALEKVNAISSDVNRATLLVVAQLERADQLFSQFAQRFSNLTALAEDAVVEPVKQSAALLQGFRAALDAFLGKNKTTGETPLADQPSEDEEPLFIG